MDLDDYQRAAIETAVESADEVIALAGLAGEVGSLLAEYKKRRRDPGEYTAFDEAVREELGDLLWYVAALADENDLSLSEIAEDNLRKVRDLWLPFDPKAQPPLFDQGVPEEYQLPREFHITFVETVEGGQRFVRIFMGDEPVGDALRDLVVEEDGYRFHDALHLAHAAVLGWSPVVRKLIGRKRRHDPQLDEFEDGGRAIAIEEGVAAFLFPIAERYNFFRETERVPWDTLKTVREMTRHLEVADCSGGAWQRAIINGFRVFAALQSAGGGTVEVDLAARELRVV